MTSRHLFFKVMREDLRHKIWMIALSSLGSFLLLPVAWLLAVSDGYDYRYDFLPIEFPPYVVSGMFHDVFLIGGGFIAIAGAVIVGLFGFRFVFHKNMIDTYHSIPIKRRTLYAVCWLNGFLIWLVPFLICLLVTLGMAAFYMLGTPAQKWIPAMFTETATNLLVLVVVFLLVYHLVLTAVMVSGNVWNTLVGMMILGFGVVSIYGLGLGFFAYYMDTFYSAVLNPEPAFYSSPLLSAIILIYMKVRAGVFGASLFVIWKPLLINFCVTVLLGILSWLLYKRRGSELAEHGITNKVFSAVLKFLVGLAAGMGGWMLFYLMVDSAGWGVFGALLLGILAFGVLDIIFSMDFKAFFAHKIQMTATMGCALVISICFYLDAFGYDTYLPEKEDIAEIAIYNSDFSNLSYFSSYDSVALENLHIQDLDAAYAYLERMTDREKRGGYTVSSVDIEYDRYRDNFQQNFATKVTLKNGRTYYRLYRVWNRDLDVVWPLISSEEYLQLNYIVHQNRAKNFDSIRRYYHGNNSTLSGISGDAIWAIAEAYNKDLSMNPETVLLDQGKLLVSLDLIHDSNYMGGYRDDGYLDDYIRYQHLDIYESMENTIAALEELGYGNWVEQADLSDIREIELRFGSNYGYNFYSASVAMEAVRDYYGVYGEDDKPDAVGTSSYWQSEGGMSLEMRDRVEDAYLSITSEDEIRELMQLLNPQRPPYSYSIFRRGSISLDVHVEGQKESVTYWIRKGDLPEKYILRFEELYEEILQEHERDIL